MSVNILAHFDKLQRDKADNDTATEAAEREHRMQQGHLEQMRSQQQQLEAAIRQLSHDLGQIHRNKDMLETEKTRLLQQHKNERAAIEICTNEIYKRNSVIEDRRNQYVAHMGQCNKEASDMLIQRHDARLLKLVDVETLDAAPVPEEDKLALVKAVDNYMKCMNEQGDLKDKIRALRSMALSGETGKVCVLD